MKTMQRSPIHFLSTVLIALILAVLSGFIVDAGTIVHADSTPTLTLSDNTVKANSRITATAQGFAADEIVDLTLSNNPTNIVLTVSCDANGTCVSNPFYIASWNVPQGQYTLTATGESSQLTAQAQITITPSFGVGIEGPAGTKVQGGPNSLIGAQGSGYQPDEPVQIYWGSTTGILEASVTTDDLGNLQASFRAPTDATPGSYKVYAVRNHKPYTLSATFPIVQPSATVPKVFHGTEHTTLSYVGFQAGEIVDATWDANGGQLLTKGFSFHQGQGGLTFTVPPTPRGAYTLTLYGETSGINLHYPVTVVPAITLDPATSNVGNTITVNGSGYSANEAVNVYLQKPGNGTVTVQTDATGTFTAQLTLPKTFDSQTSYFVYAKNPAKTDSAKAAFSFIAPTLRSGSSYLFSGSGNTDWLYGFGYLSNETIDLYWYYQQTGQFVIATVVADSQGNFSTYVVIPTNPNPGQSVTIAAIGETSGFNSSVVVTVTGY